MPAKVAKRGNKYRVIESKTKNLVKNPAGTAVDGGGHTTKGQAQAQANAVNASQFGKKKK